MKNNSLVLLPLFVTTFFWGCAKKNETSFSIENCYGTYKGTGTETIRFTNGALSTNPYMMDVDISAGGNTDEIKILFQRFQTKAIVAGKKFKIVDTTYPDGQVFFGFGEFSAENKLTINYTRNVPIASLGYLSNIYTANLEKQ